MDGRVFVLADGVAGRPDGAAASRAAVETVVAYFRTLGLTASELRQLAAPVVEVHLRTMFALAHQAVVRAAPSASEWIATSLLVAVLREQEVMTAHVGDCSAYRLRHAFLKQLTRDHRTCPPGLEALSDADQAAIRSLVCILERVLGGATAPEIELVVEDVEADDTLLFCTNGLSDVVPRWTMAEILISPTPAELACERLLATARRAGADDDATALVARIRRASRSLRSDLSAEASALARGG